VATLWDRLDDDELAENPPATVLIEAGDEADAARAALVRIRAAKSLAEVPVLIGITVSALSRLDVGDGYDDFTLMPYVPAELYMRIRRVDWTRSDFAQQERVKMGPLCIDLAAHEVTVDGRSRQLTHQEFALLSFLCQNRGRVFSRRQLLERVWGVDYYGSSRTVDIHVRRLRMKLGNSINNLETVRGVGYKMKEP
jgi:DNA-binding response OmpR family regulator